jgi:hypothetical protein
MGNTADFLRTLDASVSKNQELVLVLNCGGLNPLLVTVKSRAGGTLQVLAERLIAISGWHSRSSNPINSALRSRSGLDLQLLVVGNAPSLASGIVRETIPKYLGVGDFWDIPAIPELAKLLPFGALWFDLKMSIREEKHPHVDIIFEDHYLGIPIAIENADYANSAYAIPEVHEIYVNPDLGFRGSLMDLASFIQLATRENRELFS